MNHHDAMAAVSTATGWHKSTRSDAQNGCLEVTTEVSGWIGVRDTKLGARSPVLAVTAVEWTAMLAAVKNKELNLVTQDEARYPAVVSDSAVAVSASNRAPRRSKQARAWPSSTQADSGWAARCSAVASSTRARAPS
jgi:hypothetical protein